MSSYIGQIEIYFMLHLINYSPARWPKKVQIWAALNTHFFRSKPESGPKARKNPFWTENPLSNL